MPRLVEDIRALTEALGKERLTLVGHDWGGVVAWSVATAHPDRVERLVIVNAPHGAIFSRELATNPDQQRASAYMAAFQTPEAEATLSADGYAALDRSILSPGVREGWLSEEDRAAYLESWAREGGLTGALNWYRAAGLRPPEAGEPAPGLAGTPPSEEAVVRVPTLVIWGERDEYLLTRNLVGLEAYVPVLRVLRVPDAGHWIVHQRPALVNAAIRSFLEE